MGTNPHGSLEPKNIEIDDESVNDDGDDGDNDDNDDDASTS